MKFWNILLQDKDNNKEKIFIVAEGSETNSIIMYIHISLQIKALCCQFYHQNVPEVSRVTSGVLCYT